MGWLQGQREFDRWADGLPRWKIALTSLLLLFVAVAAQAAVVVMGPRLVREGSLLWFGERAEGVVRSVEITDAGRFKGGDPKYRVFLGYEFSAADGRTYSGVTERNDIRYLPEMRSGDTVGVYFDVAEPSRSVAEYNLRTDVYALALFLPFLAAIGAFMPGWYALRLSRWRVSRRVSRR